MTSYATDGVVVKLDDLQLQDEAGFTQKARAGPSPSNASRKARTRLLRVGAQVGRTGAITPLLNSKQSPWPAPASAAPPSTTPIESQNWICWATPSWCAKPGDHSRSGSGAAELGQRHPCATAQHCPGRLQPGAGGR